MNVSVEVKTLRELGRVLRGFHLEMETWIDPDGYFRVAMSGTGGGPWHGSARDLPDAVLAALECRSRGVGAVAR